jgi:thioredoxin 1
MVDDPYAVQQPTRAEIDARSGTTILEFGTDWCGYCQGAQGVIAQALDGRALEHLKVEDGPGRPLGRSFRVKLWPTLIVIKDGQEVGRVVRPTSVAEISKALEKAV